MNIPVSNELEGPLAHPSRSPQLGTLSSGGSAWFHGCGWWGTAARVCLGVPGRCRWFLSARLWCRSLVAPRIRSTAAPLSAPSPGSAWTSPPALAETCPRRRRPRWSGRSPAGGTSRSCPLRPGRAPRCARCSPAAAPRPPPAVCWWRSRPAPRRRSPPPRARTDKRLRI